MTLLLECGFWLIWGEIVREEVGSTVSGREFRVKRNPTAPGGAFVYDPRDRFQGVERNLVWWVPSGDIGALIAYPLNSPSRLVTPGSEFPGRAGLTEFPNTPDVVAYVFRGEPMP